MSGVIFTGLCLIAMLSLLILRKSCCYHSYLHLLIVMFLDLNSIYLFGSLGVALPSVTADLSYAASRHATGSIIHTIIDATLFEANDLVLVVKREYQSKLNLIYESCLLMFCMSSTYLINVPSSMLVLMTCLYGYQ